MKCYCLETKGKNDIEILEEFRELTIGGTILGSRKKYKGKILPKDDPSDEDSDEKLVAK